MDKIHIVILSEQTQKPTGGTVEPPQNDLNSNVQYLPPSHILHVWNIYLYIYHTFEPKVGKYSIHGAFGHDKLHPRFLPNTALWIVLRTENHFRGPS